MILQDNGRYRANKYKQAEYPLPPEVIDDIENSTLTVREICLKHGIGETSFRRVVNAHYHYSLYQRGLDITQAKNREQRKRRQAEFSEKHRDTIRHLLDNTIMSVAEIAEAVGISHNQMYDTLIEMRYDADARGRRIRVARMKMANKKPDPIDAPMCSISREWLGKKWKTSEVNNGQRHQ